MTGKAVAKRKGGTKVGSFQPNRERSIRKHDFDKDVATRICSEIALGRPLNAILGDTGMPNQGTVYRWMRNHPEFEADYARSRVQRADVLVEQTLGELMAATTKEEAYIAEIRSRQILRIAAIVNPAKYSEKILHAHAVSFAGPLATVNITLSGDAQD